eukprot:COSAG02_NODE_3346_length_6896_cov_18.050611_2_plen_38_part_00
MVTHTVIVTMPLDVAPIFHVDKYLQQNTAKHTFDVEE